MITIDMSGEYGVTIYVVARRLLKCGADPLAEMCIVRDGVASMQGVVGELARWQVREDCRRGLILTKFRAYPQPQNCVDA